MHRDWQDFKSSHSNIAGAREAFENACETLFRKIYPNQPVHQVRVKQGDGGIDIFVGELGIEPIRVIQCKFFLESFGDSQKNQIRDSFKRAVESDQYELKEWILCLPRVLDIDENSWWFQWVQKKREELEKDENFISLKNGNELIDLMKEYDIYNQVFQIEDSLKIDKMCKIICPPKKETDLINHNTDFNTVLFNNYTEESEPYYLQRKYDTELLNNLQYANVWIFGKSGAGKTALVTRNLINKEIKYCFCDLSPITINSSDDVLTEILTNIEDDFDIKRDSDENNLIKQISKTLCKINELKIVIVIDEMSVSSNNILTDIVNKLTNLVNYFSKQKNNSDLKFIISTINNPHSYLENKSKASEFFQYVCCDDWTDDIEKLYDLLLNALSINLAESKQYILENCNDSPRNLKNILRKIVIANDTNENTVQEIVKKILNEVV